MIIEIKREHRAWNTYLPNAIVVPPSHYGDDSLHIFNIVEHTDDIVAVEEYKVLMDLFNNSMKYQCINHRYRRGEHKVFGEDVFNVGSFAPTNWWGRKIQKPIDFDHHPGNIEIHEYLIGREPQYQTDRVWITKSGKVLINTDVFGWISPKLIANKYVTKEAKEELRMAKMIFKLVL